MIMNNTKVTILCTFITCTYYLVVLVLYSAGRGRVGNYLEDVILRDNDARSQQNLWRDFGSAMLSYALTLKKSLKIWDGMDIKKAVPRAVAVLRPTAKNQNWISDLTKLLRCISVVSPVCARICRSYHALLCLFSSLFWILWQCLDSIDSLPHISSLWASTHKKSI